MRMVGAGWARCECAWCALPPTRPPRARHACTSYFPLVDATNALEPRMEALSDEQLRAQTARLR